jgi:asparagine synthase (glutamine-hydrolysing)
VSGIVGIINLDGAPVDRQLLHQMTEFMGYRGPDAQDVWTAGPVGLGHTLLRTTWESAPEQQPSSLDGQVWITADARVDGRAELVTKLRSRGQDASETLPDAELLLHAYHAWGEDCVHHLLGDFAFAIWDGRRGRLFCARDHFGVKPFYYARVGDCLVFSNTLNCVRLLPAVSAELNDLAVADFLLFGGNQDPATTAFADIQRLPAAHTLTCSGGTVRVGRYWTLPVDGDIRYRRLGEYVDHFKELLRTAVEDRLRTDRAGIFMSGGLDSPAVAAAACKWCSRQTGRLDLQAFTVVFDQLIPDQERFYSGLVARELNIPIHYLVADNYQLYERWGEPELQTPEPTCEAFAAAFNADQFGQAAAHGRVALTGYGGDPAFWGSSAYVLFLLKNGYFGRLVGDLWQLLSRGRLPKVGLLTRLRRWLGKRPAQSPLPDWLNPDFAARLDLPARWRGVNQEPRPVHPRRPKAYHCLTNPFWPYLFESYDPGVTRSPVEVRHPFFDRRLLEFLLAIPPLPWFGSKELLRTALRGLLPDQVRLRPKAPMAGNPIRELLQRENVGWLDHFEAAPELEEYVSRERIPPVAGEKDADRAWLKLLPLSLNYWLRNRVSLNRPSHRKVMEYASAK